MHPLQWLRTRDRNLAALRRAARVAIVMPAVFALSVQVIGNPTMATFAAFGSFALLLLVDFGGPMRARLQAQAALSVVGAVFVCLGTLAAQAAWLAAISMAIVGFVVLFAGVVSSTLAGASTSLLLAYILPVSLKVPLGQLPDRLEGWALASGAAFLAVAFMWPAPAQDPLRGPSAAACRAIAARMRADVRYFLDSNPPSIEEQHRIGAAADAAVHTLHRGFIATPYRPTGLSTASRTVVRLVDELRWLDQVVIHAEHRPTYVPPNAETGAVMARAADVLDECARLLGTPSASTAQLETAVHALHLARAEMQRYATQELPVGRVSVGAGGPMTDDAEQRFVTSLDPTFRAQELSFVVSQIAANVELASAAEQRGWIDRLVGRQPDGVLGPLAAARERASAHLERHSVWLHNSLRGGVGLGIAVFIAHQPSVQHSFWVVLGTLSVLRSSALNTGQNIVRALLGTVFGFVVGALLLAGIGTNTTLLWFLLPLAILIAGVAPAVISFAAGQAAFTLTIVILFNIIQPTGWRVGLLRVEDVAIGCAVSLVVGLLFWPRGAGPALAQALGAAYAGSAAYLTAAVSYGVQRCDGPADALPPSPPGEAAQHAAAASRRLDDAFRSYLAERGTKPLPLADVTRLVSGAAGLRLAGDAVLDLWQRDDCGPSGDRAAVRQELLATNAQVTQWYDGLARGLAGERPVPDSQPRDHDAEVRLVDAVRRDLRDDDGRSNATAVRIIWTGDHLEAARRLEQTLLEPARAAASSAAADAHSSRLRFW